MSIRQVKDKEKTKDGRSWLFEVRYKDIFSEKKSYKSQKFLTKREASEAERLFLLNIDKESNDKRMTFGELRELYCAYKNGKIKDSTMDNYKDRERYISCLDKVKLIDFNAHHIEVWKEEMMRYNIKNSYRNDILKFIKSILKYGTDWYNYNLSNVISKIENFTNPNEIKEEMKFFTYEEFKQYISVEDDPCFRPLFETSYYLGLRRGEVMGLTWQDISFDDNSVTINKSIAPTKRASGMPYRVTSPKTKSSYRKLPMPKVLRDDLLMLYELRKECEGFDQSWYAFGSFNPISKSSLFDRHDRNCKLAGVTRIRIHDLRHSCASLLINAGKPVTVVAKYLGHSKIDETLNTYSHMFKNQLNEVVDFMDNLEQSIV